jgi:hypothetical protein
MKHLLFPLLATAVLTLNAFAAPEGFDRAAVGSPPAGWTVGITGAGEPRWTVEADASAPFGPKPTA